MTYEDIIVFENFPTWIFCLHNFGVQRLYVPQVGSFSELELKTLSGTVGPSVLDIRSLYSDLGIFTYDPGYGSTGSCESAITYIDGEEGVLLHRGYPIDQLADNSSFLEVAYLLLNGELPKKEEKGATRYAKKGPVASDTDGWWSRPRDECS